MRGEWSPHQLVCTLNVFMICSLNQRIFIIWWYECWSVFCHYSCSCLVMSSHHHLDIEWAHGQGILAEIQIHKCKQTKTQNTLTLMSPWARKTGEEEKRTIAQSKITEATVRLSVLNERIVLVVSVLFLFIIFPKISCWNISMKPKAKKTSKKEIK